MNTQEKPEVRAEDVSILAWILNNQIVNEKSEPLDFRDRLFLLDILTDWTPEIVIKKCAQIGGSVTFNLKALFAVIKYGLNIIYTFPSDSDVSEFVSSKTNKLIQANPQVFAGIDSDNIERKEFNKRFMFFKGTISKTAAIATTADLNIHDEASRSNQAMLDTYRSRIKASKYKGRWLFSNPTTEKDAIDEAWNKSDRKEWTIECLKCQTKQVLTWPDSIDPVRKCYQCKECKRELTDNERRLGKWVAQNPGKEISGYHISLLMAPWIPASEILRDSEGDAEYFYNFVLGEPYSPGDLRVGRSTILDNWTPKDIDTGTYYLGVDVGNIKHYALGSEHGLIKVGRFSKWADLDDMMKKYKPHLVIDAMPDNTMSKYYVENYRNALMSFFQENKNNPRQIVWWGEGDRAGIVYSNRNRILDQMIDEILNAKILFGLPSDTDLKNYIKHWETLRRIKVTDTRGIESYEWDSTTGEDHYCFVAGTKVVTNDGERPIEDIKRGDLVLTREGFKPVVFTDSRMADVIDRGILKGTPDHPVWVENNGFKDLLAMQYDDTILSWHQNALFIKALSIADTLTRKLEASAYISHRAETTAGTASNGFISRCISTIMGLSLTVLRFIIKTMIRATIRPKTWRSCLAESITDTTSNYGLFKTGKRILLTSLAFVRSCGQAAINGLQLLKENLIAGIVPSKICCLLPVHSVALNATARERRHREQGEGSVPQNARGYSSPGSGAKSIPDTKSVSRERVYTLEVDECHEYFANGILVSNCFATLYYYLARMGAGNGAYFAEPTRNAEDKPFIGRDNVVGDLGEAMARANDWGSP